MYEIPMMAVLLLVLGDVVKVRCWVGSGCYGSVTIIIAWSRSLHGCLHCMATMRSHFTADLCRPLLTLTLSLKENLRGHMHTHNIHGSFQQDTLSSLLQRYRQSAVHQQLCACHILAQVAGKKDCRPSQVVWIANTAQRRPVF
jgi:hypothetical protein